MSSSVNDVVRRFFASSLYPHRPNLGDDFVDVRQSDQVAVSRWARASAFALRNAERRFVTSRRWLT